jgi:hypothetical protein
MDATPMARPPRRGVTVAVGAAGTTGAHDRHMSLLMSTAGHLEAAAHQYVIAATRLRARGLNHTAAALERLAAKQQRTAADVARAAAAARLLRSSGTAE